MSRTICIPCSPHEKTRGKNVRAHLFFMCLDQVGKLQSMGQIQPAACLGTVSDLRMVFRFFSQLKNNQKKNISLHGKTVWNSNVRAHKWSYIGTLAQPRSFLCVSSMAAFSIQWQSPLVVTETQNPQSLKYLWSDHLQTRFADFWPNLTGRKHWKLVTLANCSREGIEQLEEGAQGTVLDL